MAELETDLLVIGAGVLGLAIGARCSSPGKNIVLIDANPQFGQETSSRNSEVVHSGIYYPLESFKTKWCIEGRHLLYDFCNANGISAKAIGKFVVSTNQEEEAYLEKLSQHCKTLEVPHRKVSAAEIQDKEPLVEAHSGLFFPESGIVDSHQLMAVLEKQFLQNEGLLAYRHRLQSITKSNQKWLAQVESPEGSFGIRAEQVVNCAGLEAAAISNQALETKRFEHRFCRGRYFLLPSRYQNKFNHLVYPVPPKDGLGIHITIDTEGMARLGPDVDWAESSHPQQIQRLYDCDWEAVAPAFLQASTRYAPSLAETTLTPGQIGIRPKLFLEGQAHRDFLVETQAGFTHCLGIESPGLTAALAIANHVGALI